jgi:hypothetical protein
MWQPQITHEKNISLFEKLYILSSSAEGVFLIGNVKMLGSFSEVCDLTLILQMWRKG